MMISKRFTISTLPATLFTLMSACSAAPSDSIDAVEEPIANGITTSAETHVKLEGGGFLCSGELLANGWVLTAQHCSGMTLATMGTQTSALGPQILTGIASGGPDMSIYRLVSPMTVGGISNRFRRQIADVAPVPGWAWDGSNFNCFGYGNDSCAGSGAGTLRTASLLANIYPDPTFHGKLFTTTVTAGRSQTQGDSGGGCFDPFGTLQGVLSGATCGSSAFSWSTAPAYAWIRKNTQLARAFDTTSDMGRDSTDWDFGKFKADCAVNEYISALSQSTAGRAHAALCRTTTESSRVGRGGNRHVKQFDSQNLSSDWDFGFFKAECASNQYMVGISQFTNGSGLSAIRCEDSVGGATKQGCNPVVFSGGTNSQVGADQGDWDPGRWKGNCGAGGVIAGVSRDANGRPHAALCCSF